MALSVTTYYEILGIDERASLAEIKRAYRKKAVLLHPDRNHSPLAHEDFILLTEAYEYLTNLKSGKQPNGFEDWNNYEREQSRQKAAEYANMQYEEYINSDYYRETEALTSFFKHFSVFFALVFMLGAPVLGFLLAGKPGVFGGLFLSVVTSPAWINILFLKRPELDFKRLVNAISLIIKMRLFFYMTITLANIILLFSVILKTVLATWIIVLVFLLAIVFADFLSKYVVNRFKSPIRPLLMFCLAPFTFFSLLIIQCHPNLRQKHIPLNIRWSGIAEEIKPQGLRKHVKFTWMVANTKTLTALECSGILTR